jgi:hypothetical protein
LIRDHKLAVEILVIDPFLPNAFSFTSELRRCRPSLTVIAAIPKSFGKLPPLAEVDAEIPKPDSFTLVATIPWINLIQSLSVDAGNTANPAKAFRG